MTAAGIPGVQKLNLTYVTAIGFRQPIGTATGRITYAGGTAVPDVSVLAQTNPAIPTSALGFDGVYGYMTIDETSHGSLTSQSGFTFQAWVKDTASSKTKLRFIFDKASVTRMWLDESKKSLVWVYGIDSVSLSFASVDSDYFHLSAVRNGNSLMIQLNDGKKVIQAKQTFNNFSTADKAGTFYIAQQLNSSNRFSGLIDEIRMWNIALDSATIQRDYQRVLSGTETGLEAYYQCNENVGNVAYDLTHTGNTYKGNDATLYNVRWTIYTPPLLVIKGITDSNGNYIISNIPYAAGGSTYTFTPMFGVHTFNPTQALRYFAPGSNVSNSVDFTDNSSFHVSGTVRYNNTNVPVQGVSVLVDGTMAIKNRAPVTSDANGSV